jgi:hypothetical protein
MANEKIIQKFVVEENGETLLKLVRGSYGVDVVREGSRVVAYIAVPQTGRAKTYVINTAREGEAMPNGEFLGTENQVTYWMK